MTFLIAWTFYPASLFEQRKKAQLAFSLLVEPFFAHNFCADSCFAQGNSVLRYAFIARLNCL
jgi:hypothetical protein